MSSEITKIQTPNNMSFELNMPDNMSFEINTSYNNMFFELTEDTTNELAEIEIVNMSFAIAETEMSNYRLENPEITRESYSRKMVPKTTYLAGRTTKSAHERRNHLRREAYVCKK
ncbi:19187_t:CDS:1, partial [Cetraspora pellucida]